jgi:heptosyltransferase-2
VSEPRRIVILAPNWLGDAVMALPAIDDVRRRFPRAKLTVAARPSVARLYTMSPSVDEVLELRWRGRITEAGALGRDMAQLRRLQPDLAILLPNSFASAWLARGSRAKERWGYAADMRSLMLTRAVARPSGGMHQGAYYQHLVRELGIPNGPLEPRVVVPEHARAEARTLLAERWDGVRPLVVLAPGAAYGTAKQWLPEHFATLVTELVSASGAHCVLVGSGADAKATAAIQSHLSSRGGSLDPAPPFQNVLAQVSDLCGRTSLESLAGVLTFAQACVSNDSGAMHLAAAVGAPLTALFGPTNERETAPLPHAGVVANVLIHPVSCRPCMLRECPIDHPCMRDLEPSRVYAAVRQGLTGSQGSGIRDQASDQSSAIRPHPSTGSGCPERQVEGQAPVVPSDPSRENR